MINAKKVLWMIPIYMIYFFLVSCAGQQSGSGNPGANGQNCVTCSAGTLDVILKSDQNRKVDFAIIPQCADETDYLICDISIFNDNIPDPLVIPNVSPLIYSWQIAAPCSSAAIPLGGKDIDCQFSSLNFNPFSVWISAKCLNTTKGTNLTIDSMPDNVNCTFL